MFAPKAGDLLIRPLYSYDASMLFVIVDPVTREVVSKPFRSLREAAVFAAGAASAGATIWQENVDLRQRVLGPPVRLPIRTSGPVRRSA
jgi:hypothetical protein